MSAKKSVKEQLVPGIDLRQLLIEFESALALVEVATNSMKASPVTLGGQLRSEVLALSQGTKALKAVGRTLHLAVVEVKQ
jgi:hypothetical protein